MYAGGRLLISVIPFTSVNTIESPVENDICDPISLSEFETVPIVTTVGYPLIIFPIASVLIEPTCRSRT